MHHLSATAVAKRKAPGYEGDGGGLWLQVSATGTKSWVFRFTLSGRSREMGLGAYPDVPLAGHVLTVLNPDGTERKVLVQGAREKAAECRALVAQGVDPIEARRAAGAAKATATAAAARILTFEAAAKAYIAAHRAGWRNAKHADQWQATLETYANPRFGSHAVGQIDAALVLQVLSPIWTTKTETASRLRGRIEAVLAYGDKVEHRERLNPARWRGHLDKLLPKPERVAKTEHHAALPYAGIGAFMQRLRAEYGTAARAVELIILTACRTSEALLAVRGEFDLAGRIWTIPAERTKAGREHRVPLSDAAIKLLKAQVSDEGAEYMFPGARKGQPLSNMAGLQLLKRMGHPDLTVHGFRSTFRDWCAETTNFPRELAEAALAHVLKDKTEAAYQRGDLLAKRAVLMQAWADYCSRPALPANVVELPNRAAG